MEHSATARRFLGLNAIFSTTIGVFLSAAPGLVAEFMFKDAAAWHRVGLLVLGIGLIAFALVLCLLVKSARLSKGQVVAISAMDLGWILASVSVLAIGGHLFTVLGQSVVAVVAACVGVFAAGQFLGAGAIRPPLSQAFVRVSGRTVVARVDRTVDAPLGLVWRVMTDHPGYADVADNLTKVEVVEGDGLGMQRRCYGPKGESWLETCDLYEDGRSFGFRVHTEADDYPYPFSELRGTWSAESKGPGTAFTIRIEANLTGSFMTKWLFFLFAKPQFESVLINLAEAWAARMERQART